MKLDNGAETNSEGLVRIFIGRQIDIAADVPYIEAETQQTYEIAEQRAEAAVQQETLVSSVGEVALSTPYDYQVLEYNNGRWGNANPSVNIRVRNVDSVNLNPGVAVYAFGASNDYVSVKRADNDSVAASKVIGLMAATVLQNQNGVAINRGYLSGIDLSSGYAEGDALWLAEDGAFTKTKPVSPERAVFLGFVIRASSDGIIYVAVQADLELDDLSNVDSSSGLADNDVLQYDTASGAWKNTTLSALGITLGTDTVGNYVADVAAGTGITVTHTPAEGSTPTVALNATLDNLSNVTVPSPSSGDFLKWNGSAWVNDDIDLGADTVGNYVSGVSAGTGITVTHTPSEGSTATVALNASLNNLSDVVISSASAGHVLEHNGTNFVNKVQRYPHYGLQTPVNGRKYTPIAPQMISVNTINVGSAAAVVFDTDCTITDLSIYLNATYSAATTYSYRLGIYDDNDGEPDSLLVDAGTLNIATGAASGFKTIALGTSLAVNAYTPIWLVCAATHTGTVPALIHMAGHQQPYANYGLSSAVHYQACCFGYFTAPGTAFPATWSMTSPETQPVGVAVFAHVTVP